MPLKRCKTYMTQAIIHSIEITIEILILNVSMKFGFVVLMKKLTNKDTANIHKFQTGEELKLGFIHNF